jgi:type I restriction enzyme S subunit
MPDGWRETTLGDLFEPSNERLGLHQSEPTVFSISKYDGVMPADEFFGRRVASAKLDDYKVLREDAWVYSTIHIDEGSIARNATGADGVVSPMYTVMRWISEIDDPRYAELLLRSAEMLAVYSDNAQGSINRRRSLPWKAFRGIPISLPPLGEQRRIVDLIAAVDDAMEAAEAESDEAAALLGAVLNAVARDEMASIGSLASVVSGASWGKADVRTDAEDDVTPVLTIANTKPDGTISGEPTLVHGLSANVARLTENSLIAIRTNGNHNRIGNIYRVPKERVGAAVSAFQFVVEPIDPTDSDYLYWMMSAPSFQAAVTAEASGSTGLGNIAAGKLREMQVPWPSEPAARAAHASTFASLDGWANATHAAAEALRTLRSNLLTVLLSGEHGIPSAYDALLEGEAA